MGYLIVSNLYGNTTILRGPFIVLDYHSLGLMTKTIESLAVNNVDDFSFL